MAAPITTEPAISVAVPDRPERLSAWTPKTAPRNREEDEVQGVSGRAVDRAHGQLDQQQDYRRDERDGQREEQDVPGRRAVGGKELRVPAEDVEQRLSQGKSGHRQ
jgi:hypothetical protein